MPNLIQQLIENPSEQAPIAEVMAQSVETIARQLGTSACTVRQLEATTLSVGYAFGYREPERRAHPIPLDDRLAHLVNDHAALVIPDLEADQQLPATRRERLMREGLRSYLGVAMVAAGRTEGVLSVYYSEPRSFGAGLPDELRTIGDCLALLIQRARWYEQATTRHRADSAALPASPPRILVVDEDRQMRELLSTIASTAGYTAVLFGDGHAAVRYLQQYEVDLVITDLQMKTSDGWEISAAAHDNPGRPPVIMITGHYASLGPQLLARHGVARALPKPFSVPALIKAMSELLTSAGVA